MFCSASSVIDPYKTLKIQPGASESDVKKAFRQLALQYHPDVCRGSNCGVQFHKINEAYDVRNPILLFFFVWFFLSNFWLNLILHLNIDI
ncbi:hypothetical protein RGQ29_002354 [Quercus rubra]|nr:hypothetical protein RGQ29_002354 [Quercus rubra]